MHRLSFINKPFRISKIEPQVRVSLQFEIHNFFFSTDINSELLRTMRRALYNYISFCPGYDSFLGRLNVAVPSYLAETVLVICNVNTSKGVDALIRQAPHGRYFCRCLGPEGPRDSLHWVDPEIVQTPSAQLFFPYSVNIFRELNAKIC